MYPCSRSFVYYIQPQQNNDGHFQVWTQTLSLPFISLLVGPSDARHTQSLGTFPAPPPPQSQFVHNPAGPVTLAHASSLQPCLLIANHASATGAGGRRRCAGTPMGPGGVLLPFCTTRSSLRARACGAAAEEAWYRKTFPPGGVAGLRTPTLLEFQQQQCGGSNVGGGSSSSCSSATVPSGSASPIGKREQQWD